MHDSDPPPSSERGSARLPRHERRAQIIEAAAGAFLEAGFDGTSMDDVARRSGVSRLLVYRIFETKRHLYRAVLGSVTDEFVAEFQGRDLDDIRRRGGIVRVMLDIARRHPDAFRLLWRQAANEPAFVEFARNFRHVLTDYAKAMIALDGRLSDPTMVHWCSTVLAAHLLEGMCSWLDDGDPAGDDEFVVLQVCGLFALVDAWGDPHPPPWVTPG
jgi:AcrR family transcriptional regulator